MTPEQYLDKALHAAEAAKLLLSANEIDGACNRAYYAMFNAAHAALLWSGAHTNPGETRKHSSLIAAFGNASGSDRDFSSRVGQSTEQGREHPTPGGLHR